MGEQEIGKCNNNGNMMSNFYKESGCQYECTIFMHRDSCIHKTSNSLDSHTKNLFDHVRDSQGRWMLDTSIVTNILQKKNVIWKTCLIVQRSINIDISNFKHYVKISYPVLLSVIMKVLSKGIIYRITEITKL